MATIRPFDNPSFQAMAWLINKQLNPRGYHFSILHEIEGGPHWMILGGGQEVAVSSPDEDEDYLFSVLEKLLQESRDLYDEQEH